MKINDFKFLRKRVLNPDNPEYYNTDEFEFVSVTPPLYEPTTFNPVKFMMFRNRETGEAIRGNQISEDHPMWDYQN